MNHARVRVAPMPLWAGFVSPAVFISVWILSTASSSCSR